MPRKDDPKEMTYRSYNEVEREMLRQVGFEELGLYVVMKEIGSFTNGWLGKFHQQKITYARLALEMHRNASQGRKEKVFDTTAIIRLLENLEEVGLVTDRQWDGKRLTLLMPFSPMWKGNPERKGVSNQGAGGHEVATKSPQAGDAVSAAEADAVGLPRASLSPPSVVTNSEVNRPFLGSVSSGPGPSIAGAGDPEDGAPADPATQAAASPDESEWYRDDDWLAEREAFFAHRSGNGSASMTLPAIETMLAAVGTVLYPSHPPSRAIYTSWVRKGLTRERLGEALARAGDDAVTPRDLDAMLYPKPAGRQLQEHARRRGGVAL